MSRTESNKEPPPQALTCTYPTEREDVAHEAEFLAARAVEVGLEAVHELELLLFAGAGEWWVPN